MIVVSNKGEIPLHGVRLLGQSRKRADQIGQFGTGLKETIALCLRKNYTIEILSGSDTRIKFSIQDIDGQNEVCFMLVGKGTKSFPSDTWHGMGFSPDLGKRDWNSDWQILREIICNAYDEGELFFGDDSPCEGKTKVILRGPEAEMKTIDRKLRFMQGGWNPRETIIKKMFSDRMNIFCKGVFVQEVSMASMFDYSIKDLKMTESRSVDPYTAYCGMSHILSKCDDEIIQRQILKAVADHDKVAEVSRLTSYMDFDVSWKRTFDLMHGPKGVICNVAQEVSRLSERGYTPVYIKAYEWFDALVKLGVKRANDVLVTSQEDGLDFIDPPTETKDTFEKLYHRLVINRLVNNKSRPKLKVFTQTGSEESVTINGFYKDGTVHVNQRILGSREERVTILEEICHHVTGANDCTRDFQNWTLDALETFLGVK